MPTVNVVILYLNRKYYIEKKLHTVYPLFYESMLENSKNYMS